MYYTKEIVHHPYHGDKRQLSVKALSARPFSNAKIKQGGYGFHDPDFWLQRISNRGFHVIILTLDGEGLMTMEDGTECILRKGDAFISWSSGQGHHERTYGDKPWEMLWFTVWDTSRYITATSSDYEIIKYNNWDQLRTLFLSLFKEDLYNDSLSDQALELYEELFLITIQRSLGFTENFMNGRHRYKFTQLWEKVSMNIEQPWSLDEIAAEVNISKSHIARICQELYGKSPGEMITDLKMKAAKLNLLYTDMSVSEIAESVGYNRLSSFSYTFKENTGMSPREFRKRQQVAPQ